MFNSNPFRTNVVFIVVIKEFVDNIEVKDKRQRRSFINRRSAAEYAQNQVFFNGRKQVIARIYAL